jgi:hypothetical protein
MWRSKEESKDLSATYRFQGFYARVKGAMVGNTGLNNTQ